MWKKPEYGSALKKLFPLKDTPLQAAGFFIVDNCGAKSLYRIMGEISA